MDGALVNLLNFNIQSFSLLNLMVGCVSDDDCSFMFFCAQKFECEHKPIFPLQWYPIIIYLLIPIGSGLVNVAGKSMGIVKVFFLMTLLRYNATQSTALVQPMVAGSALPNVLNVIFKRHPRRDSSLIDYDIILVIIPCSLLGSTLGSFLEKLLPELVKDIVTFFFFLSFAYSFYKKGQSFKHEHHSHAPVDHSENQQSLTHSLESQSIDSEPELELEGGQLTNTKLQILNYERSIHLPDIFISLLVFLVFQFLVFLVQGKFGFYSVKVCSWEYAIGLAVLVIVVILYEEMIRRVLAKRYELYERLNIKRNLDLSVPRNFGFICFGGYFAGLAQGILGAGSGTFIMGTFMALNLHPRVAAATSSYQILFVGAAAFIQEFITDNIELKDALFLFLLTAIGGGCVTMLLYYIFKKFQDRKVNIFLLTVMFVISFMSAIFVIPILIQIGIQFGFSSLISIPFHC